ncbi:MAG TPA: S9 family peptidase [Anaerolineae bacterium]|nr:S9 family peptidase [Anaerolineae bacterium]
MSEQMDKKVVVPVAAKKRQTFRNHEREWADDYYWLRERENEGMLAYLRAENGYTEAQTAHLKGLQEELYDELVGRMQEDDRTVPAQRGAFEYYTRTEAGKQYKVLCRRPVGGGDEAIILDENVLAAEVPYFKLGLWLVSPNQNLLAYTANVTGSDQYSLYVKDLESGEMLLAGIDNLWTTFAWAADSRTLFYLVLDETQRPFCVKRHQLGTEPEADAVIFQEDDERFYLYEVAATQNKQYLTFTLSSKLTTEVHYLVADDPLGEWQVVAPREEGHRYTVEQAGDDFLIVTDKDGAVNSKLMRAPVNNHVLAAWEDVWPYDEAVKIDSITPFANFWVLTGRRNGLRFMDIVEPTTGERHGVDFPEPIYAVWLQDNYLFETDVVRLRYASLVTPPTVYDYNMKAHEWTLLKQEPVLGGYDPANYEMEQVMATAEDGAQIPISMVYRKGMERDGDNPLFLYGYGSYGHTVEPSFDHKRISLLDRGVIFAIAHVRGGGAMGRSWYYDGKFLKKKNTFTDFIACAEHLIAEKYTRPERLAISGRSAGGLLMGAVVNLRPELFQVVVAGVPFVDVVNTMMDPTIPLTVTEYEEWGDPNDETYFEYMMSYSPYDNLQAGAYPHLLVTGGLNDPRVQYWEPTKWVAKLRQYKTDDNLLLLKIHMGAGHGGSSGRYDYLDEVAFEYAFILHCLGVV